MSEFRKFIEREECLQMEHDWHALPRFESMPIYDFPCSCGRTIRGTDRDRGKRCTHEPPEVHRQVEPVKFSLQGPRYTKAELERALKPEFASQFRVLSAAEAEARDREEVETLAARESQWLDEQGVTGFSLVIPPGPRSGKVPYLRHDATEARLVDFPPTGVGRRVARNVHAVNVAAGHPERTDWLHCAGCETDHAADQDFVRGKLCPSCKEANLPLKPPTLREWLGDRVSELGRWANVLREQPVPAGEVRAWQWVNIDSEWFLEFHAAAYKSRLSRGSVALAISGPEDPWDLDHDTLQMALFTRHPDVKPEPKPAAFPWDPYPEVV